MINKGRHYLVFQDIFTVIKCRCWSYSRLWNQQCLFTKLVNLWLTCPANCRTSEQVGCSENGSRNSRT